MLKTSVVRCAAAVRRSRKSLHVALLVAFAVASPAMAVEVPTLYTAEVPFDRTAPDARNRAYELALAEVVLRVTGSALSADRLALAQLFPDPSAYVMQFRPGADETMWVSFDGEAVEKVLRGAGQAVWGADRPLTLVWLAVDWGRGSREIIGADDGDRTQGQSRTIDRNRLLRERVLAIAERRGLPVVFPLLDTIDLQSVTFSDIWGGFDERVIDASQRYEANSILIGRIRPTSSRRENWSYYFSGEERSWNGSPESVVGQVADLLAAEFAVGGNAPIEAVALSVNGIATLEAYGELQKLLANVSLIENLMLTEVSGDRVTYRLDVRGGRERLRRALRFNGLIEQENFVGFGDVQPAADLQFYYNP